MAVAAATAVITPAAFLMSPAAYATDGSPATTETTTSTGGAGEEAKDDAQSNGTSENTGETTTPESTETEDNQGGENATSTPDEKKDGEETKDENATSSEENKDEQTSTPDDEKKDGEEAKAEDKKDDENATSDEKKDEEASKEEEEEFSCADVVDNEDVSTELIGLPSKVVAGSGWKEFTFRAANNSDKVLDEVAAYLMTVAIDGKEFDDMSKFVTVQAYIDSSWNTINDDLGYFGAAKELQPGEYADAPMRLMVNEKAPAGYGFAFASGINITKNDVCEFGEETEYEFEILAASAKPGKVEDAKGKPGKVENKPAPQGGLSEMPIKGELAATGSSSMLPTIGIAGGVAIVAGAGVVFALKRRNSGATA